MICEVNCTNCRVSAFKHGLCPDDFCEKFKALGTEDDFIKMIQRKTGQWIDKDGGIATCSVCGDRWGVYSVMKYCPNCGAKMEEGEQE